MNEIDDGALLLIFVKNPVKGAVKTRLAKAIGEEKALSVYRRLLKLAKSATDPLDVSKQVWYSQFIDLDDMWSMQEYDKQLQQGRDLGLRMQTAFRKAFASGFEKVVIIGSDCPELSTPILQQAFQLLEEHEVVVGPSQDGGYYLLGMTEFYPALFEQKKWSTPAVYEQTIQQLKGMNVSYRLLPLLNDIDTKADLQASGIDIAKSDRECNSL